MEGGLLEGLARGAQRQLGEALGVGERQLREIGELVDGGLVSRGELVDLEHVGSLVSGRRGGCFVALHNDYFRPPGREVKDFLLRRSNKAALYSQFNDLVTRRPAEAGPHIASETGYLMVMPFSLKYRSAPGWKAMGEAPEDWLARSRKAASLWTFTSSSFFSNRVFTTW